VNNSPLRLQKCSKYRGSKDCGRDGRTEIHLRVEFSQLAAPIGEGEGMIYQKNRAFFGQKQVIISLVG